MANKPTEAILLSGCATIQGMREPDKPTGSYTLGECKPFILIRMDEVDSYKIKSWVFCDFHTQLDIFLFMI